MYGVVVGECVGYVWQYFEYEVDVWCQYELVLGQVVVIGQVQLVGYWVDGDCFVVQLFYVQGFQVGVIVVDIGQVVFVGDDEVGYWVGDEVCVVFYQCYVDGCVVIEFQVVCCCCIVEVFVYDDDVVEVGFVC